MSTKRSLIILVLLSICYAAPVLCQENKQPNIIVFLVDDMGLMDTSVPFLTDEKGEPVRYPLNDYYRTPNMERLAALGTRFSTFYAQSVCSPSRASLITGQNATRHHTTQWIDPNRNNRGEFGPEKWNWEGLSSDNSQTLPAVLQRQGYRTIYVGKAHFGPFGSKGADPMNIGFDVNIGGSAIGHPGSYLGMDNYAHKTAAGKLVQQVPHLEKYHQTDTFLTEALTIEAKKEVQKAVANQRPFFLEMAHYALHSPFMFDPRFRKNYAGGKYSEDEQKFASLVEGMDHSLGQLMDQLEELGVAENTLILFLGDNGSDAPLGGLHEVASSAPLRGKKGTHYEGGMRIPFIAAWAKPSMQNQWQIKMPIKSAKVSQQLGTIMDVYPTIMDLLSLKIPANYAVDGFSLKPNFSGKRNAAKSPTFLMHFPHDHRSKYFTSFRDGDWKLVYHYFPEMNPALTRYELFNLKADPYEQTNLAPAKKEMVKKMVHKMAEKLEKEGALYPEINNKKLKPIYEGD